MTVQCHPDLQRLALAAAVDSPAAFSILDRQVQTAPDQLLPILESELYRRLYCGVAENRTPHTEDPAESLVFISALSRANTGVGTWEPGWTISGEQDDAIIVIRDDVTFWAERSQVRTASGKLSPGEKASVRIGKEMRHLLFSFYMALGNNHPGSEDGATVPLVRLYWHLSPDVSVTYIHTATERLNDAGIPFQTKVVSNPRQYDRRDNGVLYLRRGDFGRATPVLRAIYRTVKAGLMPDAPLFTKVLAPGLALAEDPGQGVSFGQSRCHMAAVGLWQCHRQGLTDPDQRVDTIAETFRAEGIDPERPYLEPGSADCYDLDLEQSQGG